ncbi:hypothetical protein ACOTC5_30210 [Achromobacter xylosoxidans]
MLNRRTDKLPFEVTEYLATVVVQSVHEQMLEFVLDAADSRRWEEDLKHGTPNAQRHLSYCTCLETMIKAEFAKNKHLRFLEWNAYGYVSVQIGARTPAQLTKAIERTGRVIQRWLNKYRIAHMPMPT